ncbi:NPC intracellular cholesterol transporter 2 homolog a isoform X2 [Ooceraea biroi]|uniref:NPC intracellular cholesterol transporter 2 homolog a isoform X2 n=1 Tax=Ooceraea biroi TaxID=2015173 RepID=UPI0005B7F830|nr:NPC intracellular cholesterol transporter 2 homolog a isoform X2 [Ooceraea biroi]
MHRVTLAFLCVLCCSASCLAFTFADCGSTLGKFTEVSVSGCQTSDEKCALVRGTNASISIAFTPSKHKRQHVSCLFIYINSILLLLIVLMMHFFTDTDITQVNARVYGVLIDIPVPFPLDKPDACKDPDDGISCPLHKNQEYHYRTSIFVQNKFPKVSVDIKWELVNEKNENIVCIEFPAKIK